VEIIKDGYTRATEVLSQWDKFSMIDSEIFEKKTILGTNVHEAIANYYRGIPTELTEQEQKYFDSFYGWNAISGIEVLDFERRMYDETRMLTGAMDLLAKLGEDLVLVDWKCSYNADKLGWPLQASFYMQLLKSSGYGEVNKAIFVKLDKEGCFPKLFEFEQSEELIALTNAALLLYRYQKPWIEKRKFATEEFAE